MPTPVLMPSPRQRFVDNLGLPLVNGMVYTYAAGTSDQLAAFQDAAGVVPHQNPIRLDERGEATIYWLGNYKVNLRSAIGIQVPGYPVDNFNAINAADISSSGIATLLASLFSYLGSSLIGFIQGASGAVKITVQDMLRGIVDPRQFGAAMDGVTDDTVALQRAVNSKGYDKAISIKLPAFSTMKISGTVFIPALCTIDLNGCLVSGNATNTIFETGYWVGGSVVTNHGQPNETALVYSSAVFNGQITNCDRGFKLFNFCEGSRLEDLRFTGTNQPIYASRCFYGSFSKILARAPIDLNKYPCYNFSDAVNAIGLESVFAVGYKIGWQIDGTKDNFAAYNCGAEACATGVTVINSSFGMKFSSWYFENVGIALSFSGGGNHENVDVGNCFFNTTTTAIVGSTITSGIFRRTNKLNGAAISLGTNFSNALVVEIPTDITATNAVVGLPSAYALGDAITVDYVKSIYNTSTGNVSAKAQVAGGMIPLAYAGDCGEPITNAIPFCTSVLTATTLTVTTKIRARTGAPIFAQFDIADTGIQAVTALAAGIVPLVVNKPVALTVTFTNVAGFITVTVSGLTAATSYSGVVRLLS